jgi:putative hydrolase of the HAD superfamily
MIKTVIFDLDDTLYSEVKFIKSGFMAVSKHISSKQGVGCKKAFSILCKDYEDGIRKNNLDILLQKLNLDKRDLKLLVDIYRHHKPSISPYHDAERLLKENKGKIKFGLLTNGDIASQKNKISALKIKKYFSAVAISSEFGDNDWESSKKSFDFLLKLLKSKPSETAYVGDNPNRDFAGAKKLGIYTIRIKRKDGLYRQIKQSSNNSPDLIISNLREIEKLCQTKK